MARRGTGVEIEARITDNATAGVKKVAAAISAEADKIAKSDQKLAKTAAEARKEKNMQLTASQKLKFALEKEAAAGDPVATQLAELNKKYMIATRQASAFAKAGEPIPQELLEQATAAKKAAAGLKDLGNETEEVEEKSESLMDQVNGLSGSYAAAGLAMAAAAAAAVAGTIHLTTSTAELGDKIAKSSRNIGLSTTAYQGFDHAMQVSGTSIDEQSAALSKVNKKIREAAEGVGTGAESFKRLGIDVKDSSGNIKSSEQVMLEIADAFKELPDGVEKSAASLDLFGGSGAAMTEFLNLGSTGINELTQEAQDLGIVMGADALNASEQFNDSLGRFTKVAGATQSQLGQLLVKAFTPMLDHFTDLQTKSKTGVDSLKGFVKGMINFGGGLLILFTNIGARVGNVFRGLQVVGSLALGALVTAVDFLAQRFSAFMTPFKFAFDGLVALGVLDSNPIRGFTKAITTATADMKAGVVDNINETVQAMTDADNEAEKMSEGFANMAGDMLHAVDSMTLAVTPAVDKAVGAHGREFEAITKSTKAVQNKVKVQKLATTEIDKLHNKELAQMQKLEDKRLKDAEAMISQYAGPVGDAFQAFGSNIKDVGQAFKEFGKSALNSILSMVEQSVMAYAAQAAAGAAASQAGIPIVGPVLAGVALAATFALVRGLLSTFNKGGIVPGGGPNKDSVMALLTPGEIVLPRNLSRMLLDVAGRPASVAANTGGVVQSGGGGFGGITVNMTENVLAPRTPGQLDKFVADQLVPALSRLKRRGFAT